MTDFSPREIVSELDRFIIGQHDAKRAVAIALRNRWRRLQLDDKLREEVLPKNILMIGPTGVGKTEISRRLAKLAGAPFIKVEATKFTEVGYVGRDVEQIVRDLLEVAIAQTRERKRKDVGARAALNAEERVVDALVGANASASTKDAFRKKLRAGELDDKEIEIEVQASQGMPLFEIPGMPGAQMGAISIGDIFGKLGGGRSKTRRVTVSESHELLIAEESDKLLDNDAVLQEAIKAVENNGIVFLDEIDKICGREGRVGADVSREGVQRDLLPLIEGTTVSTKHGAVKTDHILFISSGAFHLSKPSDLLPELQGRLPIRVELHALTRDDFRRILTETEASLIKQYVALLATEGVTLEFTADAVDAIADVAVAVNSSVENIGARRLQTVMERVLDEISFAAPDPFRRQADHRCGLCREAYRRSRQRRRSEPIYSLGSRLTTPAPQPHVKRTAAAMHQMGVLDRKHVAAEFGEPQPLRHHALENAPPSRSLAGAETALAGDHQHEAQAVLLRAAQEAEQRPMRLVLRAAMQVDATVDRFGAARQPLLLPALERRDRRRGFGAGLGFGHGRDGRRGFGVPPGCRRSLVRHLHRLGLLRQRPLAPQRRHRADDAVPQPVLIGRKLAPRPRRIVAIPAAVTIAAHCRTLVRYRG